MAMLFSNLVDRVKLSIPPRGGLPSIEQCAQVVRDSVNDFNEAATRIKVTQIQILSGVATYTLPADFVKLVALRPLEMRRGYSGQVIVITESGLVPMAWPLRETVTIEGDSLRITPTPTYTLARELHYGAGHVESGSPAQYAEMTEREARIILLLAQSIALGYQANQAAGEIMSYQIGDERVDRTRVTQDTQARSTALRAEYDAAVSKYVGTVTR
jgi:hypothetical protein